MLYFMKSKNNGTPVPKNDNFSALAFKEIFCFSVHFRQQGHLTLVKSATSSSGTFLPI